MTNAVLAIGTLLQKQDPIALTWATISEVRSLNGPGFDSDEKQVTNHSSPGRTQEWLQTLNSLDPITFTINYIPNDPTQDENTGILYDHNNFNRPNFRIVEPDTGHKTFTFPGYVKSFKAKSPVDDVMTADLTIRPISAFTITGT